MIALYIGALTVLANYPEAPEGEHTGGWLGEIFNLNGSNADLLDVKSKKMIIPTEIADVNLNKQVPTKEYVDKKVEAAGGGTVVINGSTMPTMISTKSPQQSSWGAAAAYCANLKEADYTDWRMPTRDELVYMVAGGGGSAISDGNYLWTSTMADSSITDSSTTTHWLVLWPSDGYWGWINSYNNNNYVRCVR